MKFLLAQSHLAEIIIVKGLIQGRNKVTREQIQPRSCNQNLCKNDLLTLSTTPPACAKASTQYYKTVTLAKTVQQQVFLQLIRIYTIVFFMHLPFIKIVGLNYFGTIYKILSIKRGAYLDTIVNLIRFQQLLRAPLSNPFCGFGICRVLARSTHPLFKLIL